MAGSISTMSETQHLFLSFLLQRHAKISTDTRAYWANWPVSVKLRCRNTKHNKPQTMWFCFAAQWVKWPAKSVYLDMNENNHLHTWCVASLRIVGNGVRTLLIEEMLKCGYASLHVWPELLSFMILWKKSNLGICLSAGIQFADCTVVLSEQIPSVYNSVCAVCSEFYSDFILKVWTAT